MTRLGIIIGVSENKPPLQSLGACRNDGSAIADVLKATLRFDDLLILLDGKETASANVKDQLATFIAKHKSNEIDEIVFYFSGHGDFVGDEFYHILSDYDANARNRTSLANSELDGLIRALSPRLFVKIVDACHSGTSYIKSGESLREFLKDGRTGFRDVYFLYSSQSDQVSWASDQLSAFTECLLAEIGRRESGAIRYRDLMNAASDYFEAASQTPHFVTQSDFTEIFCEASPTMRSAVAKYLPPIADLPPEDVHHEEAKELPLLDRIRMVDSTLCTREEAERAIEGVTEALRTAKIPELLEEVFSSEIKIGPKAEPVAAVGEWAAKHKDSGFFVEPEYVTRSVKRIVPKDYNPLLPTFSLSRQLMGLDESDTKEITERKRYLEDYRNTGGIDNEQATIWLEPKFKSVTPFSCLITVISSLSHLRLFWTIRQYKRRDWSNNNLISSSSKWESEDVAIREKAKLQQLATRVASDFYSAVEAALKADWLEPASDATQIAQTGKPEKEDGLRKRAPKG